MVLLGAVPLALTFFTGLSLLVFILYNLTILVIALLDARILPAPDRLNAIRLHDNHLMMGIDNGVALEIENKSDCILKIVVRDDVPAEVTDELITASLSLKPGETAQTGYNIHPMKRGSFRFGDIYLRATGILGFVQREYRLPASEDIQVFPDLTEMEKYRLFASKSLRGRGSQKQRVQGIALDFRGLRDYNPDDAYRSINWNASARVFKPITNLYDIERSQNIIIAMDTGRTMFESYKGYSRLDYSIAAALIFARVADDSGDKTGLALFSSEMELFIKPDRGAAHQSRLLDAMYAVQPGYSESDIKALVHYLGYSFRKRSLICLFSSLPDADGAKELLEDLAILKRKHGILFISPENPGVYEIADLKPGGMDDVYKRAAAIREKQQKSAAARILSSSGVPVVYTHPDDIVPSVISMYRNLRSRGGYI